MFLTIKLSTQTELIEIELIICIKMDLTLNNLQRLICHKTLPTNQPTIIHSINYNQKGTQQICWYQYK